LISEPHNNLARDPGDWTMTVDEEREFLEKAAASEDFTFLVAEIAGQIAGTATLDRSKRPSERYSAVLGLSVDAAYRRRGIGTALICALIARAKELKLRRLELKVFTRNAAVIALYEKLGFRKEGLHPMAALKQGIWVDDYTMGLLLDAEVA
jgi:putative acetyltransferase